MADLKGSRALESAFDSETFGQNGVFRLDKPVGSASISPCGRDVVLASRQGLHIIDLDSPWSPPRHLEHYTPWEVADVQWSPFAARDYWVVSTSNQKALVWNLAMTNSRASIEHVLHAHTRAITDINFSAHHPDILATCAVDSFVHCWDLRHPARPAMTFCDWFAGATQVKWNRQDAHILASSHDKFLRIWDDRKGAYPLRSIEAHATKIYGVDWNRAQTNNLVTCSLDKTIKFWDYTRDTDTPEMIIKAPFPVWRARHTPFGSALLAMPQRADHDLHLYSRDSNQSVPADGIIQPVHRFYGHEDQVKEFLWRSRGNVTDGIDYREFQLVSWGTDRILRLHHVDESVLRFVGHEKGKPIKRNVNITRRNAKYKTFRENLPKYGKNLGRDRFGAKSKWDVGMGGSIMNPGLGWGIGGSTRSMAVRAGSQRQDIDALSWMRGVKIGKREGQSGMHQSLVSMFSPSSKTDRIWDTFELSEEITHVGDKFAKVTFDKIDMPNRFVIVFLSGPWGAEGVSTFVKAGIDFPKGYPEEATPTVSIEKTASISSDTLQRMNAELQQVANAYMSGQRNSLEAMLRYLLGEQSLEESLAWLKERPDHNDLDLIQDPGSSSSDEDDEEAGRYNNAQGQGMDMSDGMIAVSNAQYNVPLPIVCGVLWSGDGHLVCFFPPKDKAPSLLDLSLKNNDRSSRSHKIISEGFGRFYNKSPAPRNKASTLETIESDESNSDTSSMSTSGSSSSSDPFGVPPHHYVRSSAWRGDNSETQKAHSVEDSQLSSGGTGPAKSSGAKSYGSISIHDFRVLLPAKKTYAQEYVIGGPNCCLHNAEVAARLGNQDLADAWDFVNLILQARVPLSTMVHPQRDTSIMVVARNALSLLRSRELKAKPASGTSGNRTADAMKGGIKWGHNPFGWQFVDKLFRYFEQLADVQMLALLSCVFSEFQDNKNSATRSRHQEAVHQVPEFSRNYFPSEVVATSLLESDLPPGLHSRKNTSTIHSANSSILASNSDPMTPFSTGGTPPSLHYRPSRTHLERSDSHATSISTSPEHHRNPHRSNSNLASAFTASLSRPFSFTASASSSPPIILSRKRLSPAGSYQGAAPPGITWGSTSLFGKSSTISEDPKPSSNSVSNSDGEEGQAPEAKKPSFGIKLKNQDQFRNDGYADVPLLDPNQEQRYRAYRESYIHLLHIWGLSFTSCEIQKYNSATPTHSPSSLAQQQGLVTPMITTGKSKINTTTDKNGALDIVASSFSPTSPTATALSLRIHCTTCAETLPLHHSALTTSSSSPTVRRSSHSSCPYCSSPQTPLICILCASIIRGLASPCLSCGHVLHLSCRAMLLALEQPPGTENKLLCVSGCGCDCSAHSVVQVEQHPYSSRRKGGASMTMAGVGDIGGAAIATEDELRVGESHDEKFGEVEGEDEEGEEVEEEGEEGEEEDDEEEGGDGDGEGEEEDDDEDGEDDDDDERALPSQQEEDEDAWEDVAYESLARNLGRRRRRYLLSRSSQVLRGNLQKLGGLI